MISQYSKIRLNLYSLRNLTLANPPTEFHQSLTETAQTLGYEALLGRGSLSKVDSYYNPWIAHCQVIHCVVVWRDKGDRILILPFSSIATTFVISIL
jgi:ABC-type bacteriocin/lantibiotic exporter with double-glycine peptidase domain